MASNKTYQQAKFLVNNNIMGIGDKVKHLRKPVKRKPRK